MFQFLKGLFGGKSSESSTSKTEINKTKPHLNKRQSATKPKKESKSKTTSQNIPNDGTILKTNAPDFWPILKVDNSSNMFPAGDARNWLISSLMYASKILEGLNKHYGIKGKSSFKENVDYMEDELASVSSVQQLTAKGIMKLTAAVKAEEKKYAVIVFEQGVNKNTIDELDVLLSPYGYEPVIWYSPSTPIDDSQPASLPKKEFDKTTITHIKDYKSKHAQYAMWWSRPGEPLFSESVAYSYINEYYSLVDGYETSINGLFGVMLNMHPSIDRVDLPDDLVLPIEGPGSEILLLGISKKRGFNFYFPVNEKMHQYRDDFLREMIPFTKSMLALMKERNYKQDKFPKMPIDWWKQRIDKVKLDESNRSENTLLSIFEPIRNNNPEAN